MLDQRMPIAFTPDANCLPEVISIRESVILVKSGASKKISGIVFNQISYNIELDQTHIL